MNTTELENMARSLRALRENLRHAADTNTGKGVRIYYGTNDRHSFRCERDSELGQIILQMVKSRLEKEISRLEEEIREEVKGDR